MRYFEAECVKVAGCAFCKTETEIHDGGAPICVACLALLHVLREDFQAAKERSREATAALDTIAGQIPSASTKTGGAEQIQKALRAVTDARMEMLRAYHRLHDFLNAGIVPEDLGQGRGS